MEDLVRQDTDLDAHGRWWYPSNPQEVFHGRLVFARGVLTLEAFDNLKTNMPEAHAFRGTFEAIHGDVDSKAVTLLDCHAIQATLRPLDEAGPEVAMSLVLRCTVAVFGAHVSNRTTRFRWISVSFTNLEEWVQDVEFESKFEPAWSVSVKGPKDYKFDVPTLNASVAAVAEYGMDTMPNFRRAGLWVERWLCITPREAQLAYWFNENFWLLRLLMTVFVGVPTSVRAVKGGLDVVGHPTRAVVSLLYSEERIVDADTVDWTKVPFPLPRVIADNPNFMEAWFAGMSSARRSVELFVGAIANPRTYPHQHFLSLVQALESFHRQTAPGNYMSPDRYGDVRDRLVAAIPEEVASDHRQSLSNRIKFGNQYSLRKRLNDLIESLPPTLSSALCVGKTSDFTSRVVDTRNFFTHWDASSNETSPYNDQELRGASNRLSALLAILLVRRMGLSDQTIRAANLLIEVPRASR
jgi:hypothetical protein